MVVVYPSESSVWSFVTNTPRVIFHYRGSIIPHLLPQILIAIALSFLALHVEIGELGLDKSMMQGYSIIGFLLSFLLVFKTQTAYNQFWTALSHVESCMNLSRCLGMSVCTRFNWEKTEMIPRYARRIIRLIALHWFVVIEYFGRSGPGTVATPQIQDALRDDIRHLTGEHEFATLYPGDERNTPGSESSHPNTNSFLILYWIDRAVNNSWRAGGIVNAPAYGKMVATIGQLHKEICGMNKIDKLQFPLPYAQIVKLLSVIWVFSLPFVLVEFAGYLTPLFMTLIAIGFFGLDEVAEILESPFQNKANNIDLKLYGQALLKDLELVYNDRDQKEDYLFDDSGRFNFAKLMDHTHAQADGTPVALASMATGFTNIATQGVSMATEFTNIATQGASRVVRNSTKSLSRMSGIVPQPPDSEPPGLNVERPPPPQAWESAEWNTKRKEEEKVDDDDDDDDGGDGGE